MWPAKLKIFAVYPSAEKYTMTLAPDSQDCGFNGPFPRCSPHIDFLSLYTPVRLLPLSLCIWLFLLLRMFFLQLSAWLTPHLQVFAQMSLFTQRPI